MNELKPCPFCGGKPVSGMDFYESTGSVVKLAALVRCKICGIGKSAVFQATDISLVPFSAYENAMKDAIDAWNQRADTEGAEDEP